MKPRFFFWILVAFSLAFAAPLRAAVPAQVGPYRVEVTTEPATIPVGKAQLRLKVTDASNQPVEGATVRTLAKMPGMAMGEREELAAPMPGAAGVYQAPAAFPMGGEYSLAIHIIGPRGEASGNVALQTGQNTGKGASTLIWLVPLGVLLAFVAWRMKRSGQSVNWRGWLRWQTFAGLAVLLAMLFIGRYAVTHWRRSGAMTPLEAQGMEMNLPAPAGAMPVALATVSVAPVRRTVRYSGQAVGFNEQEVLPRVTGNLLWMPLYVGDKVKRGQLLARLDRSQIEPQIAAQRAAQSGAEQGENVARGEYRAALSDVTQQEAQRRVRIAALAAARKQEKQARSAIDAKVAQVAQARADEEKARATASQRRGGVSEASSNERKANASLKEAATQLRGAQAASREAQSDLQAAREDRSNAQADVAVAQTAVDDAQAEVPAAQAEVVSQTQEIERLRALVEGGAVARRELELQVARAASARAKLKQAQARVAQSEAAVRGAQSRVRRAQAAIGSAQAKSDQAAESIAGAQARGEAARAEISASRARTRQSQAEVSGAGAGISGAGARVRQMQADVQAAREEAATAAAKVRQAQAELDASGSAIGSARAQAGVARDRIAQAQSGVAQAQAGVAEATTQGDYTEIRSLLDGVVTQRLIAPGTLVSPGQAILKIAQINPIRLQANVAESDLQHLQAGSPVTVRDAGGKGKPVQARLSSVAPAVDPQSRLGLVEAVVPNPQRRFLPGEYVVLELTTGQSKSPLSVPAAAVQQRAAVASGEASNFTWVAESSAGEMTARAVTVQIGVSDGKRTEIRSGLKAGQKVVTSGYQYLHEGDAVTPPPAVALAAALTRTSNASASTREVQKIAIAVTDKGFEPASVSLRVGVPARLTFTRKTEATCATEVHFPELGITKKLPMNQPVAVEFTPKRSGALKFACGMDMIRGQVVR